LREFGIDPIVHDPLANPDEARHEYGLELSDLADFAELDCVILAVNHDRYLGGRLDYSKLVADGGVFIDVKAAVPAGELGGTIRYWSL